MEKSENQNPNNRNRGFSFSKMFPNKKKRSSNLREYPKESESPNMGERNSENLKPTNNSCLPENGKERLQRQRPMPRIGIKAIKTKFLGKNEYFYQQNMDFNNIRKRSWSHFKSGRSF
jgi:hypothetical protein